MRFIYPPIFRKNKTGGYTGFFPDLKDCQAQGDTLEEAVDNANEAARDWITVELEDDCPLPTISDTDDMPLQKGDVVRNIAVTIRFTDGWDE